jgi:hypothetical protein
MQVVESKDSYVNISDMKDGDIAEIISWNNNTNNTGKVIQRIIYGHIDWVIFLGEAHGKSYANIKMWHDTHKYKVKILPAGTILKV